MNLIRVNLEIEEMPVYKLDDWVQILAWEGDDSYVHSHLDIYRKELYFIVEASNKLQWSLNGVMHAFTLF
jgi:hypothetical protein